MRAAGLRGAVLAAGLLLGAAAAQATEADEALWDEVARRAEHLYEQERFIEGAIAAEEALKIAEQAFAPNDFRLAESLTMLAAYYRQAGRTTAAEVLDRRVQSLQRQTLVERQLGFAMRWAYGAVASEWPGARHVILRFADYPAHVIGIYSKDLWTHLETLPTNEVYVTFSLSYDTEGRMRRYEITRIGDLEAWQEEFRYAGAEAFGGPSPWDLRAPAEPSDPPGDDTNE
jgi:hypothetical protein